MPPHRDWTRRGAGRALLHWPLVAFILVAAFPALAVPLVVGSGLGLLAIGLITGYAGKRRRARRLARARRALSDRGEPAPSGTGSTGDALQDVWPTGRHARRPRTAPAPTAPTPPAAGIGTRGATAGEPVRRDAA